MVSLKQRQSGFTIVELLIVIVIIGILATLVIVTFSGVQQKARDSERKTDINAIAGQLEAFYANKGYYPTITDVNDATWRTTNEFKIDTKAFVDPSTTAQTTLVNGVVGSEKKYYYVAYSSGTTDCGTTAGTQCASYIIGANLEQNGAGTYKRQSN
ncbi:MAG TPA: type II secretion system protein [Candidatus Saccharimonadales bacterium]|jgi:prepilin-type N-terminal cleavage/methylation domain-containing protein